MGLEADELGPEELARELADELDDDTEAGGEKVERRGSAEGCAEGAADEVDDEEIDGVPMISAMESHDRRVDFFQLGTDPVLATTHWTGTFGAERHHVLDR